MTRWMGKRKSAQALADDYRENFKEATPAMPDGWQVHHTKQDKLRERYQNEKGINIDDPQYLKGVPDKVHQDINYLQNKWAESKMRELGILGAKEVLNDDNKKAKFAEFWSRVSLDDAEAFEKTLDKIYAKYWIKAGDGEASVEKGAQPRRRGRQFSRISSGTRFTVG